MKLLTSLLPWPLRLSWWKLAGGALALALLLAMAWLARDRFAQKALADAAQACARAAATPEARLEACLPALRARVEEARRAEQCEAALTPALSDATRFSARMHCGGGTRRLIADRDAARDAQAALEQELARLAGDTGAAVMRAEERGRQSAERRNHLEEIIHGTSSAAAVPGSSARIACDAECLRRLVR